VSLILGRVLELLSQYLLVLLLLSHLDSGRICKPYRSYCAIQTLQECSGLHRGISDRGSNGDATLRFDLSYPIQIQAVYESRASIAAWKSCTVLMRTFLGLIPMGIFWGESGMPD
jgi:hypothetical protein